MVKALNRANAAPIELDTKVNLLYDKINALSNEFYGNTAKTQVGEKNKPTINDRMFAIQKGIEYSPYGPTDFRLATMKIINEQLPSMGSRFETIKKELDTLAKDLQTAGASCRGIKTVFELN